MTNNDEVSRTQLIQARVDAWVNLVGQAEQRRESFALIREVAGVAAVTITYVIMELLNGYSGVEGWTWAALSMLVAGMVGGLVYLVLPSISDPSAKELSRSEHWRCEEAARAIIAAHAPGRLPDNLGRPHCWEVVESDLGVATCQARGVTYTMKILDGSRTVAYSTEGRFVGLGGTTTSSDLCELFKRVCDYMGKKADEIVVETIS